GVLALAEMVPAVADPFLYAGLLAAGLVGCAAISVGLSSLVEGRPQFPIEPEPLIAPEIAIASLAQEPQPDGPPEPVVVLFTDRIRSKRAEAAEAADLPDHSYQRLH